MMYKTALKLIFTLALIGQLLGSGTSFAEAICPIDIFREMSPFSSKYGGRVADCSFRNTAPNFPQDPATAIGTFWTLKSNWETNDTYSEPNNPDTCASNQNPDGDRSCFDTRGGVRVEIKRSKFDTNTRSISIRVMKPSRKGFGLTTQRTIVSAHDLTDAELNACVSDYQTWANQVVDPESKVIELGLLNGLNFQFLPDDNRGQCSGDTFDNNSEGVKIPGS